jgi:hypothetical protein
MYPSAYRSARKLGLIKSLFPETFRGNKTRWDRDSVVAEASKYQSRQEFYYGSGGAYNAAKKLRILDDLFGYVRCQWDECSIRKESTKYKSRIEFCRGNGSAYATALKKEMMDELFPVTNGKANSDKDTLYLWKAVGQTYNGKQLFKIGVTSARLGDIRIVQVATASKFKYEKVVSKTLSGTAVSLEQKLLSFGESPQFTGFVGCTEFRALSDSELSKILILIGDAK